MTSLVYRNTAINIGQFVFSTVIVFWMTPIYLSALGDTDYGVWQVLSALIGYAGLFDLGFQPTVARFISRFVGRRQQSRLALLYGTTIRIVLFLSLLPAAAFLVWSLAWTESPLWDSKGNERYGLLLMLVAGLIPLAFLNRILVSATEGLQAYGPRTLIRITCTLAFVMIFVQFHHNFDPLLFLCVLSLAILVLRNLLLATYVFYLSSSPVRIRRLRYSRALARELLSFGGRSFALNTATTLEERMDTLIVSATLGPSMVVTYALPQTLASYVHTMSATLSHAFMPAMSSAESEREKTATNVLFLTGSRLVISLTAPLAIGVWLLGSDFIALWVGSDYAEKSAALLPVLVLTFSSPLIIPLSGRYLTAVGRHGILAVLNTIRAALHLALSIWLVREHGLLGVVYGGLAAELLIRGVVLNSVLRRIGIGFSEYSVKVLVPCILPLSALAAAIVLGREWQSIDSWSAFLILVVLSMLIYGAFVSPFFLKNTRWVAGRFGTRERLRSDDIRRSP